MSSPALEQHSNWSFRLILVCLIAHTDKLSVAWISLAKLLLLLFLLVYLIVDHLKKRVDDSLTNLWRAPTVVALVHATGRRTGYLAFFACAVALSGMPL